MRSGNGLGHALVQPVIVLCDPALAGVGLRDCFEDAISADVAMHDARSGFAVLLHVCALLAALGIAMRVKITLVEAHGA